VDKFYRVNDPEQTKLYAWKHSMFTEKPADRKGRQKPEMEGYFRLICDQKTTSMWGNFGLRTETALKISVRYC